MEGAFRASRRNDSRTSTRSKAAQKEKRVRKLEFELHMKQGTLDDVDVKEGEVKMQAVRREVRQPSKVLSRRTDEQGQLGQAYPVYRQRASWSVQIVLPEI